MGDAWLAASVCTFLLVWAGALAYATLARGARWADPIVQFLAFDALFTLPLPIRALMTKDIEGDVTEHLPRLLPYLPAAVFLAALGVATFVVAYYSRAGRRLAQMLPLTGTPRRDPWVVVLALGAFSLALLMVLARAAGGLLGFVLLGYGSSAETFGKGYLAVGFPWLYVASLFLLYRYAVYRRRADLVLFVVSFVLQSAMQILMGNRSVVLYMTLVAVLFVHMAITRLSLLRLTPIVVGAFIALNVVGLFRSSGYASVSDFLSRGSESIENLRASGDINHGVIYTLTTGEFVVPFETMPQMIRSVGTEVRPRWGATFATAPVFFVPSVLFPARPLPLGNWYMRQFYGDVYGLNEGRAFYFLAEAYLNFGPIGVPLLMLAWGVLWRAIAEYARRSDRDPGVALIYAVTVAYMFRLIAGDATSLLVGVPEQDLIPVLGGLVMLGAFRRHSAPARRLITSPTHG